MNKIILLYLMVIPVFVDAGRRQRKSLCARLSERLCKLLFMTAVVGTQAEKLILDCQNNPPRGESDSLLHAAAFECDYKRVEMLLKAGYNSHVKAVCSVVNLDTCTAENKKKDNRCQYAWYTPYRFEVGDEREMGVIKYTPEEAANHRFKFATSEWLKKQCLNTMALLKRN